jgi:glycosyltransferase involved in cell wall biosynthesis
LDEPNRARAVGDALRRRAADQFAWPALIERLAAIYRTTLSSNC